MTDQLLTLIAPDNWQFGTTLIYDHRYNRPENTPARKMSC
jgi:hypothetical protein